MQTFIINSGITDNKYLIITPQIKKKDLYKEYKGKREAKLDKTMVKELVDSLLYTSNFLLGNYNSINMNEILKMKERLDKFNGRKTNPYNEKEYCGIISIMKENHSDISWRDATKRYSQRNQFLWTDKKIKSKSEATRQYYLKLKEKNNSKDTLLGISN